MTGTKTLKVYTTKKIFTDWDLNFLIRNIECYIYNKTTYKETKNFI